MTVSTRSHALPPKSRILVTGANGFYASHLIRLLLTLGYNVRGSVREPKPWLTEWLETEFGRGRYEECVLSGFEDLDLVKSAVDGTDAVAHVVR